MSSRYARPAGSQPRPPICRKPPPKIPLWLPPHTLLCLAGWRGYDAWMHPYHYSATLELHRTPGMPELDYTGQAQQGSYGLRVRTYNLGDLYHWECWLYALRNGVEVGQAYGRYHTQPPHPYDSDRQILYPGIMPDTTTEATVTL